MLNPNGISSPTPQDTVSPCVPPSSSGALCTIWTISSPTAKVAMAKDMPAVRPTIGNPTRAAAAPAPRTAAAPASGSGQPKCWLSTTAQ